MSGEQQIRLLVTFDYEVFLGRNYVSDDEVLFAPTRRLLELCGRLGVPATFFADVCSAWAHQKQGLHEFVERFESQLVEAVKKGHDVQLHLHPHWLHARREGGQWHPSPDRMYLAELGFGPGEDEAPAVIRRGVQYLERLLKPHAPDYRCVGFRAAGLALEPRAGELIAALGTAGIRLDSSVAKGLKLELDTIQIDYRSVPAAANWRLAPQTGIGAAANGLFEVPVATFKSRRRQRVRFLVRRARDFGRGRMRGAGISRSGRQTRLANLATLVRGNLRYVVDDPYFLLSCDTKGFDLPMLLDGLDDYLRRHQGDRSVTVAMLNHPKLMFDEQFELLEQFIGRARERYGSALELATCQAAAEASA